MKEVQHLSIRQQNFFTFLVSIIILGYGVMFGSWIVPDTQGYLTLSVIRPPLYPLLTKLFYTLFASDYLLLLVVFQITFILAAAYWLSQTLRTYFKLPSFIFLIVHFLLVSPLIPAHRIYAGIYGNIGNTICSEALSYGIFIISLIFLVKSIFDPSRKNISIFSFFCVLNTLNRLQFVFMYPIIFIMILFMFKISRNFKIVLQTTLLIIVMMTGGLLADRQYHKFVNGVSIISPGGIFGVLGTILFVSDTSDAGAIENAVDRSIIQKILQDFDEKRILLRYHHIMGYQPGAFYFRHFAGSILTGMMKKYQTVYKLKSPHDDDQLFLGIDSLSKRVLPTLLSRRWLEYSKLSVIKFIDSFTFREGIFIGVLLMMAPWRLRSRMDILFMIIFLMTIANRLIVTPSTHLVDRLLFYTDNMQQVILAAYWGNLIMLRKSQII
ncbi:MAG: hypothetical protein WCW53_03330 [Syntrophales bacterium]